MSTLVTWGASSIGRPIETLFEKSTYVAADFTTQNTGEPHSSAPALL